jgi:hypothetical protein
MSKLVLMFLTLTIVLLSVSAQDVNTRFGKVSESELKMTHYPNDTSAVAVVLYEEGYTSYDARIKNLIQNTMVSRKIKILTNEGVDNGNVYIDFMIAI